MFEDLRLFLDSFPKEAVNEALQTFEQMIADDPVNFDCEDIDIKENVSTCTCYLRSCTNSYKLLCKYLWPLCVCR